MAGMLLSKKREMSQTSKECEGSPYLLSSGLWKRSHYPPSCFDHNREKLHTLIMLRSKTFLRLLHPYPATGSMPMSRTVPRPRLGSFAANHVNVTVPKAFLVAGLAGLTRTFSVARPTFIDVDPANACFVGLPTYALTDLKII